MKHLMELIELKKLSVLDIGSNLSLSSKDIQCLSYMTSLLILRIPFCKLSDVSVIFTLPKLQIIDIRDNGVSQLTLANLYEKFPYARILR